MPQSKSFNKLCAEIGLQCGFISKRSDGRLWIDAGILDCEFYEFCNLLRKTISNEALEALEHGLQYVEENSANKYLTHYINTINKLKEYQNAK